MISQYDKWSKLRTLVLGRSYYPEFYATVKNPKIKSCLQKIAEETEEDYLYFESQLKSHNIEVLRPHLDINDRIDNYINESGRITTNLQVKDGQLVNHQANDVNIYVSNTLIPKPPMTPRDSWSVVGNKLLRTAIDHPSTEKLLSDKFHHHIIDSWQTFGTDFPGGNIFQIGKDIYLGKSNISLDSWQAIQSYFPQYRWHMVDCDGHVDATYHPIKEGAIISLFKVQMYEHTFPNWDVLYLPNQSWSKVGKFLQLKTSNQGKWWVPGEEDNLDFTNFVESWLNDWVGYVEETVFDVNCLVLDDKHCFVNNYNEAVFDFLKKHRMEPIIIPFRHRYFWDGGLHCITLELNRDGSLVDLFPARSINNA